MSQSSSPEGKTRHEKRVAETSSGGAGDVLKSHSVLKSRDPGNLEQYLEMVLPQPEDKIQEGDKRNRPQRPTTRGCTLQSTDDIRNHLKNVIEYYTCKCSGKEKTEYLLKAARACRILTVYISDSLVDEARTLLPYLAYRLLATCLVQEAQQTLPKSTPCAIPPFGATLLSHFRDRKPKYSLIFNDEWKGFLAVCTPEELPSIFKHLISIGVKQFISNASDVRTKEYFHPALEFILVSKHSVDGLALLLKDEVEQRKDQPASFFSNTELGSLLALNTVISRKKGTQFISLDGFLSDLLCQIVAKKSLSGIEETVQEHVSRIIPAVATALLNILDSLIVSNRQSVLTWMTAIINSNRHNQENIEHRSNDAYMVTFCAVLLHMWTFFLGKQMKSVDFRRYSFRKSNLNVEVARHFTGEPITVDGGRSCNILSETQVVEELFFCCHGAVVVCLLPILRRFCELGTPQSAKLQESDNLKLLLRLDRLTLWGNKLHDLVAQMYLDPCNLLLELLDGSGDHGNKDAEEQLLIHICLILDIFIEDMIEWISRIVVVKRCFADEIFRTLLELCIRLLDWRHFSVMSSPKIAKNILKTLFTLGMWVDCEQWITTRMDKDIEQVPLSLLIIYMRKEFVGNFIVSDHILSLLNKFWHKTQFQRILHKKCEARLLEEFLISFLHKLQGLVGECASALEESEITKHAHFEWLRHHVQMLCTLTDDNLIHPMLCLPPLYSHTYSTVNCVVGVLRNLETSCSLDSMHLLLTNQLKSLLGKSLETLLCIVGKGINTQVTSSDLSENYSHLKMIKEGPFSKDDSFTNLTEAFTEAAVSHSENQEKARMADESWLAEHLSVPLDEDALLEDFHTYLEQARLCTASLLKSHRFEELIKDTILKPERKELAEWEMKHFKRTFTCNLSSAMFIVVDTERVDVLRCAISGPVGTPYSRGLFVFDIFCPADYPSVPPRVRLVSTVDGAVFFGSYVEMKEFSSASLQKKFGYRNRGDWSIRKVLHLLQNMMLTAMKETTQHSAECTDGRPCRLCQVRAQTVRHAMLEPLKKPPVGLEEVVRLYFTVQQQALLKQCARWVKDCVNNDEIKTNILQDFEEIQLFNKSRKERGREFSNERYPD